MTNYAAGGIALSRSIPELIPQSEHEFSSVEKLTSESRIDMIYMLHELAYKDNQNWNYKTNVTFSDCKTKLALQPLLRLKGINQWKQNYQKVSHPSTYGASHLHQRCQREENMERENKWNA